jgi:hypothetical protein
MPWVGKTKGVVNPEYRPVALGKMDRRTWQARLLRDTTADLIRHCGGAPSVTQELLIEQVAQLRLRLALFDLKHGERGRMSLHDSRTYLAWANSYGRLMRLLGLEAAPEPQPTWQELVADFHSQNAPRAATSDVEHHGAQDSEGAVAPAAVESDVERNCAQDSEGHIDAAE